MDQQSMLTALLQEQYGSYVVSIQPMHRHAHEDRGLYRVISTSSQTGILQILRHTTITTTLLKQATVLEYLARCGYPAPRPILTLTRKPVSTYQNWSALFTTSIEGRYADFSCQNLTLLGASLGRLHKLTEKVMTGSTAPLLPGSRFQLASAIPYALGQLLPEAHRVPLEVWPLYSGLITTLHRIQQTINLPITIIHGDSWPHNAIYTANNEAILTNWKSAGVGPAILDISYLLLISHLQNLELSENSSLSVAPGPILPDEQAIAAIVQGYRQQRKLTTYEHSVLLDAVRFGIAFHGAQYLPAILHGQWRENGHLKILQACYNASADIASLALQYFEQELAPFP